MKLYTHSIFIAAICMTMLGLVNLRANADAWVAELSQGEPEHTDSLEVWLPVGEYTTVGVYDTNSIEVSAPGAVSYDVCAIWFEQRTIFQHSPYERQAEIAYYLPPTKYLPDAHAFAVQIKAEQTGKHRINIECDGNTVAVTLNVTAPVPAADCGFGFHTDYPRYGYPDHWRQYFRHMRQHGANTFTCYGWNGLDGSDIARQMDYAAEIGMADPRFPVFVLPQGWASNFDKLIEDAKSKAKYADRWPELIGYNADEPSPGIIEQVAMVAREYHECGFRTGTSISGPSTLAFGQLLDICCVHMDGTWNAGRSNDFALASPDGPISTVGLEGWREGIVDYRILRELERQIELHGDSPAAWPAARWLQVLADKVDTLLYPEGMKRGYWWDSDLTVPAVADFNAMRKEALEYLDQLTTQ